MKNTVIANRKKGDWEIIKKYFEDRGVDTNSALGWCAEYEGDVFFYYGVINDKFNVFSEKQAQQANATILEVSDIVSDTVTLPKSFVLHLHKVQGSNWKKRIEEVVPELFVKNELIVGKWYKPKGRNYMFCFNGQFGNCTQYGFDGKGNWNEEIGVHKDIDYVPATEQEVFEALNAQRIKLGLVKGATVKTHQGTFKLETEDVVYSNKHGNEGIYIKQNLGIWICMNGKWAELISEPIPDELQTLIKKLGKDKIIEILNSN